VLIENKNDAFRLRIIGWGIGIYPVVAHIGLLIFQPRLAVSYLIFLLLLILLYPPRFLRIRNLISASFLIISMMSLTAFDLDYLLIYIPPIAIPSILIFLFMRSLRKGCTPLVTRFAQMLEGDGIGYEREVYTRHVTELWVGVFGFMILVGSVLAVWAPIEIWSWVTHIGNYVLIALVLSMEIFYRQYRFKIEPVNIKQFLLALATHRWR